ncbi:hydrolase TatD [Candidatus Peregrinibacteria bacterium CG_4_10_14_0_2_um_filter_38_24]|nr:MAG: hydrolase TatD [Candidatus Peregrinibacteria bacterium CG_4_10_14_0_2_um_filter_38_24]
MLIDTHAHLMFKEFENDLEDVLSKAKEAGVEKIINIGCDVKSSQAAVKMADEYENLYATLGLHPYDAALANEELMDEWRKLILKNKKIVAIGECGLDYFKADVPKDVQKSAFRLQIALAESAGVPLIVHCRDAYDDCLEILDEKFVWDDKNIGIVLHCYSGNLSFAEKLWKRGVLTSFTGIVTYPNAKDVQEVAKKAPMDLFMVETDCPYLAPQIYRGNRNEPAYVFEVARKISELKNISLEEVIEISVKNSLAFFGV